MKLNKNICKKCHYENSPGWSDADEDRWNTYNQIWCVKISIIDGIPVFSNKEQPIGCPYILEHLVLREEHN